MRRVVYAILHGQIVYTFYMSMAVELKTNAVSVAIYIIRQYFMFVAIMTRKTG